MSYIWPIALVVFSNIIYQICAKSVPEKLNPFASLTVTYLVAAAACGLLYLITGPRGGLLREYRKLNWAPLVLGIVIIGLASALLLVGFFLYHEALTWSKVVGVVICMVGLVFINLR